MLALIDLLRVPQVDTGLGFDISPDGRNVAFAWNRTGNYEIYELSLSPARDEARAVRLISSGEGSKFSPRYSPDGSCLAYAVDLDGSESYHIILHVLGTNAYIDLTSNSDYAHQPSFAFSPDGRILAVLSDQCGQFSLYLLSMESAEKRLLLDVNHPIWGVSWSPDGKWIASEAEAEASDRVIIVVEVKSGNWQKLKVENKPLNAQHPTWSPDSRLIAFSAIREEWSDIGLYKVGTGEIHWLTHCAGDDMSPCWSRDGRRLSWLHAEGAANQVVVHEEGAPEKRYWVSTGIHHHPQFTAEGAILVAFESPKQPPDLWKLNEDSSLEQLTNSLPDDLYEAEFIMPEEISYENEGVFIPTLLYRGNGDQAVIDIHGGPNWNVQFSWNPIAAHMTSRGWTVLAPNYRGSTGYGRAWQIASRFDLGGVDTRDCAAGVDYLLREKLADTIAVTGRSHGGYLTMTCLTQFPELWCGGSAVVPFMNWFKSHVDSRQDLQHWNIENMGDPEKNYERWYNASPYFFLEKIDAPVQLICGGHDPRCPASDSQEAHAKLIQLGKDVQLLLYEDEGHSFLKIENVIDSEVKRVEFLAGALAAERPYRK
jgi:dipeptidyl aminopeptidase/acylaminoacyl peptidase